MRVISPHDGHSVDNDIYSVTALSFVPHNFGKKFQYLTLLVQQKIDYAADMDFGIGMLVALANTQVKLPAVDRMTNEPRTLANPLKSESCQVYFLMLCQDL